MDLGSPNSNYEIGTCGFRQYIEHATAIKDARNAVYACDDLAEAITQYAQAIEDSKSWKTSFEPISEEEERDHETRSLSLSAGPTAPPRRR